MQSEIYVIRTSDGQWVGSRDGMKMGGAVSLAWEHSKINRTVRVNVFRVEKALPIWDRTYKAGERLYMKGASA